MAKIIINRKSEWMNKLRSIHVYINDKRVGSIKNDSSEEFNLQPGVYNVQCKIDWCSCEPLEVRLKENEVKVLKLQSGMKYYWIIAIIAVALLFLNFVVPYSATSFSDTLPMIFAGLVLLYLAYFLTIGRKKYL